MICDDDLLNIFRFLNRKHLKLLQLVSYHWYFLLVAHNELLPKMRINTIQVRLASEMESKFDVACNIICSWVDCLDTQLIDAFSRSTLSNCSVKIGLENFQRWLMRLSNCYVDFMRIEIGTLNGWLIFNNLFEHALNGCPAKKFNFLIHRLNISTMFGTNDFRRELNAREMANFFSNMTKKLCPQQFFSNLPANLGNQIEALKGSGIFPTKCKHLDLQENESAAQITSRNNSLFNAEMLKEIIFVDYKVECDDKIEKNGKNLHNYYYQNYNKEKQWLTLYWMSHGPDENNTVFMQYSYWESAVSSLSLFPIEPDAEFVASCVQHFLSLKCTKHLIGRRIRLCKEQFERNGQRLNEKLHNAIILRGNLLGFSHVLQLKSVSEGEYFAENSMTGDKICLLFIWHQLNNHNYKKKGCEFTKLTTATDDVKNNKGEEKNGKKAATDPKYCAYKNAFVLEFPLHYSIGI